MKRADINRSTSYAHYPDVRGLVEKLKTILLEKAISTVDIPERIRQSNAFKIQINFFIGGILNTYQQWLQGNLTCSVEEIMEQIANLITSNADTYRNWKY